ncbi:MAG: ribonuclease P protein component [Hyphomicrobium aestuarii]|nr:ribonuclease P protein component [Hyphomicrobium aestuarii]
MNPALEKNPLPLGIVTLKSRAEFQRVRGGGRAALAGFVLEGKRRVPTDAVDQPAIQTAGQLQTDPDGPRFGFTITKKLGNAVVRNRIRRRLKSALRELAGTHAASDMDYVVVARSPAFDQDFAALKTDLAEALRRVASGGKGKPGNNGGSRKPSGKGSTAQVKPRVAIPVPAGDGVPERPDTRRRGPR